MSLRLTRNDYLSYLIGGVIVACFLSTDAALAFGSYPRAESPRVFRLLVYAAFHAELNLLSLWTVFGGTPWLLRLIASTTGVFILAGTLWLMPMGYIWISTLEVLVLCEVLALSLLRWQGWVISRPIATTTLDNSTWQFSLAQSTVAVTVVSFLFAALRMFHKNWRFDDELPIFLIINLLVSIISLIVGLGGHWNSLRWPATIAFASAVSCLIVSFMINRAGTIVIDPVRAVLAYVTAQLTLILVPLIAVRALGYRFLRRRGKSG